MDIAKINDAVTQAERLLKMLESVRTVCDAMRTIGSLENAVAEAQGRADLMRKKGEAAASEAARRIADAEAKGVAILEAASAQAEKAAQLRHKEATERAASILSDYQGMARELDDMRLVRNQLTGEIDQARALLKQTTEDNARLSAAVEEHRKTLAEYAEKAAKLTQAL